MFPTHACREHQYIFPLLIQNCGYSRDRIPQLEHVSRFLRGALPLFGRAWRHERASSQKAHAVTARPPVRPPACPLVRPPACPPARSLAQSARASACDQ